MKNLRTTILAMILAFLISSVKSENPCGVMFPVKDTTNWGIGFIKANIKATIKGFQTNTDQKCYIGNGEIVFNNETRTKISELDFVYLGGYSTSLYKVFQVKDTKYNICANSIKGGVWVEFDDLSKDGLAFETYTSFIAKNKNIIDYYNNEKVGWHVKMGVNLNSSCLNLRDYPSIDGKIITCLKNNLDLGSNSTTTHIEIQGVNNGWAYIIARLYIFDGNDFDNPDGCASTVIKEYKGYVKIIGKNGIPNIWYAQTSY